MKKLILGFVATLACIVTWGQSESVENFIGCIPIKGFSDSKDPKGKWYHLSRLTFKGDSVFLDQSPVVIHKKDTVYSASDGGFYTYRGVLRKSGGIFITVMDFVKGDYCCPETMSMSSKPVKEPGWKHKTLKIERKGNPDEVWVDGIVFRRTTEKEMKGEPDLPNNKEPYDEKTVATCLCAGLAFAGCLPEQPSTGLCTIGSEGYN